MACVGVNNARNAGLLAARILSIKHEDIGKKLQAYAEKMADEVAQTQI